MELLWILIFGNFVSLTDEPLNLSAGINHLSLQKPISAINTGATLEVDITSMVPTEATEKLLLATQWVDDNIPSGCLSAVLAGGHSTPVFGFEGHTAYRKGSVKLILTGPNDLPLRQDFSELTLSTCMALPGALIYWRNHGK